MHNENIDSDYYDQGRTYTNGGFVFIDNWYTSLKCVTFSIIMQLMLTELCVETTKDYLKGFLLPLIKDELKDKRFFIR